MASDSNAVLAAGDRLSRLGDAVLGHILSFLPATEAARAAALSRRWRHVFAAVHTLSFREAERTLSTGYRWFQLCSYCERGDDVRAPRFVIGIGAALHGRDRGARAAGAPLRALRVVFDEFGFRGGDTETAVDGWLSYAACHAGDALEVDLRLNSDPICARAYALRPAGSDSDDEEDDGSEPDQGLDEYITPKSLFSCAVLRTLRLDRCRLDLPSSITLPSLATLHLTRVTGESGAVQRLVSECPRLADLTLEACCNLTDLVIDARLRRLALRCCHKLETVVVDSSELRAFEYRGTVPKPWFLSMLDPCKISFCTLDFCGQEPADPPEQTFLELFAGLERLHLTSARLGRGVVDHIVLSSGLKFPTFPFPALRNLELTGMLPEEDDDAIAAFTMILKRTPSLETLSLFFLPEPHPVGDDPYRNDHADAEAIHAAHKLRYDRHSLLAVPDVEIPCLRERTREINFVHYQGAISQRMLAKFLLSNALLVDEVCCEFARGPLLIQTKLMEEIKGWVMNKSANMKFF